ncbi:MAG: DinB family protein [Planctomycetota bacterium]|nr:DinB family protein [Planctomycetota bacterium]
MKTTDFIAMSLEMSKGWVLGLIEDMKDAATTAPTPQGGNHPLWVLGHLAFSEGQLVNAFVKGEENPLADWGEVFGQGTKPVADASKYPAIDDVLARFEEMRAGTLSYLSSLSDDDLDKPSHAPEEMKDFFGTVGQCFAALPVHFAFHGGQVADARRAAGREPLMG